MATPFAVPSKSFRSRTAAKDYIRDEILHRYRLRERIPAGVHDQLLREVLELHSNAADKIGSGVDYFYVEETWRLDGREAVGKNQRAIVVVRTDGSTRDWSYRHVIDDPTAAANVKSALYFALEEDRLRRRDEAFAAGQPPVLDARTGEQIPQKQQADTVHDAPTWGQLTSGFVDAHGGWNAIETHSGHGRIFVGRDVEDGVLRAAWINYYREHARPVFVRNETPER